MLFEKNNTLILSQYAKSIFEDKMPYIIYADIKSLSKKLHGSASISKNYLKKRSRQAYSLWILNVNHLGI